MRKNKFIILLAFMVITTNLFSQTIRTCEDMFDTEDYLLGKYAPYEEGGCNQYIQLDSIEKVKHGYWIYHSHFKTNSQEVYFGFYEYGRLIGLWKRYSLRDETPILLSVDTYVNGKLNGISVLFSTSKSVISVLLFEESQFKDYLYKKEENMEELPFIIQDGKNYINSIMLQNKIPVK